jgi:hypothetical protein
MFCCCMMIIEWKREGMMIIKEGVVFLNNVGTRFQVLKLFKKLSKLPKKLNNEILCFLFIGNFGDHDRVEIMRA